MRVLLLRHGHAGSKSHWRSDDRDRPLTARGRRDAEALERELGRHPPDQVISSPYLRCLQTLEPLTARCDLVVDVSDNLAPDRPAAALKLLRELVADAGAGSALACTHGEVISEVLSVLAREDGLDVGRRPPNGKGCLWVLQGDGAGNDRVVSARYVVPGASGARSRPASGAGTGAATRSAERSAQRSGPRSGTRSRRMSTRK